jgi:hypothetical protein
MNSPAVICGVDDHHTRAIASAGACTCATCRAAACAATWLHHLHLLEGPHAARPHSCDDALVTVEDHVADLMCACHCCTLCCLAAD